MELCAHKKKKKSLKGLGRKAALLLIFKIVEIQSQEGQTGHRRVPKNSCLLAYFLPASFSSLLVPFSLSYPKEWLSWSCRERSLLQTPRFPSPPASPIGLVYRQTGSLDFSGCRPEILTRARGALGSSLGFILVSGTVCWLVERWYCFSCKNLPTAFLHLHIPAAGSET